MPIQYTHALLGITSRTYFWHLVSGYGISYAVVPLAASSILYIQTRVLDTFSRNWNSSHRSIVCIVLISNDEYEPTLVYLQLNFWIHGHHTVHSSYQWAYWIAYDEYIKENCQVRSCIYIYIVVMPFCHVYCLVWNKNAIYCKKKVHLVLCNAHLLTLHYFSCRKHSFQESESLTILMSNVVLNTMMTG